MRSGPHHSQLLITMDSSTKCRKTLSYIPTAKFYTSISTTILLFYTMHSESRCALRLRYVDLVVSLNTWAIPKSTSNWLAKKKNREQNFIIHNSHTHTHNCITSPHSCRPHSGTCRTITLVFAVPRHRTLPPSYATSC